MNQVSYFSILLFYPQCKSWFKNSSNIFTTVAHVTWFTISDRPSIQ